MEFEKYTVNLQFCKGMENQFLKTDFHEGKCWWKSFILLFHFFYLKLIKLPEKTFLTLHKGQNYLFWKFWMISTSFEGLHEFSWVYGPRQANLVLIAYASSEGSGETAQSRQNLRCSLIQTVSQEEPSDRKPDPWPLWMAGHAQLKFVMMECSKTQIRLTRLI